MIMKIFILTLLKHNGPMHSANIAEKISMQLSTISQSDLLNIMGELRAAGHASRMTDKWVITDAGREWLKNNTGKPPISGFKTDSHELTINEIPEAFSGHQQKTKLQQIVDLAQVQLDSIATGDEPPVQFANLLIEIRDTAQDLMA